MAVEDIQTFGPDAVVVRLLNSPLRGCEFLLPQGRTLFLVGPERTLDGGGGAPPELPADTLYVPLEYGGVNFEVIVDGDQATIRELGPDDAEARVVDFSQALDVGALQLALRPRHQDWLPDALSAPAQPEAGAAREPRRGWWWLPALALVLAAAGGAWWLWNSPQRQAAELSTLLGGNPQRFRVLDGRDGRFYVASADLRARAWAAQALLRSEYRDKAQALDPGQENERIARWLADTRPGLAYYHLQLDDPRQPQLWISRQRAPLDARARQLLSLQLMGQLPYASQVDIVDIDDASAAQAAESGLSRQALPFSRSANPDSVTFVIEGALDDGELERARRFVDGYYRQWGGRYVQFAIELKDDWLKGKSFAYGSQGYVKMTAGHWYFPKPL
ncbi:PrgH/EprH family type III secretion apparatus protein [Chromobacterium vaccinii]|uniref:PrgH/EprH family type III secretion apparatus protein n=1 Tax=Chromobacterium vaccinii TaxID=1108595 RepID=UPI003C73ADDB